MSATHLVVCPSCARHVRAREESCPFCRSELGEALRQTPEPRAPAIRLSRGALYAFGVGSLTVATMCGSSNASVSSVTVYGGPSGVTFPDGVVLGGHCEGKVYVDGTYGYAFCDDGMWAATDTNPATADAGYTPLGDGGVTFDASTDAEARTVDDASTDAAPDGNGVADSGTE